MVRPQLTDRQRRLLRIVAQMPLASVPNLASVLGAPERGIREALNGLRRDGWMQSLRRGMTERRQNRWFVTRQAIDLLYAVDHRHPTPREEARAAGRGPGARAALEARFALDHDHLRHLGTGNGSPFSAGGLADDPGHDASHEHPPWTATERGLETALRRLATLEPLYRLAPDLLRGGLARWPDDGSGHDPSMTDFRLLRHGGFYHAVARYGERVWVPFTYAGIHATERALRRKRDHRLWGVDCYLHQEGRYLRISNRMFHDGADLEVEPSAQVVIAADAWAVELARRTRSDNVPTAICTSDGQCDPSVQLRPSSDLVSDPMGHPTVGWPERIGRWLERHPDVAAIDGRTAYRIFAIIAEFPGLRTSALRRLAGGSPAEIGRRLRELVEAGLVSVFDRRLYLEEPGMRRAANLSRMRPAAIRGRHGPRATQRYRNHEQRHNDGINELAVAFAREGVRAVAGWRGEVNVPNVTQVCPDLLVIVAEGPLGPGPHYIEFERSSVSPWAVNRKLRPYRSMAWLGRPLPLMVVCETSRGEDNFQAAGADLPLLTATLDRALAGPLTGAATVWRQRGEPVSLRCARR